jgi:asparagine synthase (glutamine-hydrolysing)
MCGISGLLNADPRQHVDPGHLTGMADALAHRGPDGRGVWIDGAVGLAHRRLAIIDLDGGAQPMGSLDSHAVVTFNGEIYNFRELARDLTAAGLRVRDRSDTSVVLAAYDRWGETCVEYLRGMFAFAIWDPTRRRLFAARDRLGIKPFYYRWDRATLAFASDLTALLALPGAPRQIDDQAFESYLRRQYVPGAQAIVRGIRRLPPGHTLSAAPGADPVERRYWRAGPGGHQPSVAEADDARDLARGIDDAVRSHLIADVPVGAFLSGGIDSSLIVARAVRHTSDPIHTFSVGFEGGPRFDESEAARRVADQFGTLHHARLVTAADAIESLPRMIARMDEPLADYAALPVFLVSELAARHVKVVLTGEGADELFGGYRRYRRALMLAPFSRPRASYLPSRLFHESEIARLLGRPPRAGAPSPFGADADRRAPLDSVNALLTHDIEGWLADDLLVKVDRMTMASSLEARVPYLDHPLVERALAIPGRRKVRPWGASKIGLRRAAAGLLPPDILTRPKHGFTPPVDAWFRDGLGALARDALSGPSSRVRARLDGRVLDRLLDEHALGGRRGHQLWGLLVYELWSRAHGVG